MKKLLLCILCLLLSFTFIFPSNVAFAETDVKTNCKGCALMDYATGEVLYCENENDRLQIASMTKIMTLLLAFEEIENSKLAFDEEITISDRAMKMGGSQVFLQAGDNYKVDELIKSIVIASANDASVAIAERIGGSVEGFVDMMNAKAKELDMNNTHFENPTGLPQEGAYSSALDCAKMMRALLTHKDYFKFSKIWMDEIHHKGDRITEISNTNKLLRRNIGVDAGKTGFTNTAMHCISASSKKGDMRLISVIVGGVSSKDRFDNCETLLNYGYQNFESVPLIKKDVPLTEGTAITRAKLPIYYGIPEESISALTKKRIEPNEIIEICYDDNLKAPINKGDKIGIIKVYKDNTLIDEVNILASEDIERRGLFDKINLN